MDTSGLAENPIDLSGSEQFTSTYPRRTNITKDSPEAQGIESTRPQCLSIMRKHMADPNRTCPYAVVQLQGGVATNKTPVPDVHGTTDMWHDFMVNISDSDVRRMVREGVEKVRNDACLHCRKMAWLAMASEQEVEELFDTEDTN